MFRWLTKGSTLNLGPAGLTVGGRPSAVTSEQAVFDWSLVGAELPGSRVVADASADQIKALGLAVGGLSRVSLVVDDSLLRFAIVSLDKLPESIDDITGGAMEALDPCTERSSRLTAAPAFTNDQWIVCAIPPRVDQWITLLSQLGVKVTAMAPSWIDRWQQHAFQEDGRQLVGFRNENHVLLIELDRSRIVKLTQRFLPATSNVERDKALIAILDEAAQTKHGNKPWNIVFPGDDDQNQLIDALAELKADTKPETAGA